MFIVFEWKKISLNSLKIKGITKKKEEKPIIAYIVVIS